MFKRIGIQEKPFFLMYHNHIKCMEYAQLLWGFDLIRLILSFGSRVKKEKLMPKVKHSGGSVMLWACFSVKGLGNLLKNQEI